MRALAPRGLCDGGDGDAIETLGDGELDWRRRYPGNWNVGVEIGGLTPTTPTRDCPEPFGP
jgi:hypothetical protein